MKNTQQIVVAGVLIALGVIIPIAFHTFNMGGKVFLPMHIPILLGGFLLNPLYAFLVGIVTPLISSFLTSMPQLFPTAIQMMFELSTYGLVISCLCRKNNFHIFPTLIIGMITGRFIAGVVNYVLLTQFLAKAFSLKVFLIASFITPIPGILIQLVMIPIMVKLLQNAYIFNKVDLNDIK